MNRKMTIPSAGVLAGAFLAIVGMAMAAGAVIDDAAGFTTVDPTTGSGRGSVTAGTDAMYIYVLGFGILGGALIAYVTTAAVRSRRPAEPRFSPGAISILGSAVGAISAYSMLRIGIGIGGTITNEVVTISAFRGIVTFISVGAVAGGVVALVAERWSNAAVLALEGEAWPQNKRAFMAESLPAMAIPALALVVIAITVFGVSRVLLIEGVNAAFPIAVASVIAVGVLAGAAYLTRSDHQGPTD